MARDGVRTLYLQTGNYEQHVDLVRPHALGRFVDAAHAAGMRVVAWYLPSFLYPEQDTRRALAAIRFRSAKDERFDSFALDIEASLVRSVRLRSQRLLQLSARLRTAVGRRYPLGAIIPPRWDPQASPLLAPLPLPAARPLLRRLPADGLRDRPPHTRHEGHARVRRCRHRHHPHAHRQTARSDPLDRGPRQRDGREGSRRLHAGRRRLLPTRLQPVRLLRHQTDDLESARRASSRRRPALHLTPRWGDAGRAALPEPGQLLGVIVPKSPSASSLMPAVKYRVFGLPFEPVLPNSSAQSPSIESLPCPAA